MYISDGHVIDSLTTRCAIMILKYFTSTKKLMVACFLL